MPPSRRNRNRRPGRRKPFQDPKPTILIVCEGEKTEPQYLEGFQRACLNPRVSIHIPSQRGVPRTLVEVAKQLKKDAEKEANREGDDNLRWDSIWCVFDIDEHPNVANSMQMARDNDIQVAASNPCFELWLLLHFRDSPGMQHRDKLPGLLARFVPDYNKHVDYAEYAEGYQDATRRAEQLDASAERDGDPRRNPTTGVYKLTQAIEGE